MSCGVGYRRSLYPKLLWLWHRPVATALIRPLAWEPPYAAGVALEKTKRQKNKTKQNKKTNKKETSNCILNWPKDLNIHFFIKRYKNGQ